MLCEYDWPPPTTQYIVLKYYRIHFIFMWHIAFILDDSVVRLFTITIYRNNKKL